MLCDRCNSPYGTAFSAIKQTNCCPAGLISPSLFIRQSQFSATSSRMVPRRCKCYLNWCVKEILVGQINFRLYNTRMPRTRNFHFNRIFHQRNPLPVLDDPSRMNVWFHRAAAGSFPLTIFICHAAVPFFYWINSADARTFVRSYVRTFAVAQHKFINHEGKL